MHDPPVGVDDADVLAAVRRHWAPDVDAVVHLPVGFGAHHWRASVDGRPTLFVTLDRLGFRHDLDSLRTTYAATAALDLEPRPRGPRALGRPARCRRAQRDVVARGRAAERPGPRGHHRDADRPARRAPPAGLRRWAPLVGPDLAERLADAVRRPWDRGPLGEPARTAIAAQLDDVATWTAAYHRLAEVARTRDWVATHGQPGLHNQLVTAEGLRLVDWESLMVAPAERDLRWAGAGSGDAGMLEMFALEWRLDEVVIGADRFQAPHTGTADDHETLANLLEELGA